MIPSAPLNLYGAPAPRLACRCAKSVVTRSKWIAHRGRLVCYQKAAIALENVIRPVRVVNGQQPPKTERLLQALCGRWHFAFQAYIAQINALLRCAWRLVSKLEMQIALFLIGVAPLPSAIQQCSNLRKTGRGGFVALSIKSPGELA